MPNHLKQQSPFHSDLLEMQDWNHLSYSYRGTDWWGWVNKTAACVRVLLPLHLCGGQHARESRKWWTAAPVKYQYCIIQALFPLKDDLLLSLKVRDMPDLCPLTFLSSFLLNRLGLDPKLLAKILNMSSGRCWSSDTYNPVPGVMEGVPSANNYQGGFGTTLMAKVSEIFYSGQNIWVFQKRSHTYLTVSHISQNVKVIVY